MNPAVFLLAGAFLVAFPKVLQLIIATWLLRLTLKFVMR